MHEIEKQGREIFVLRLTLLSKRKHSTKMLHESFTHSWCTRIFEQEAMFAKIRLQRFPCKTPKNHYSGNLRQSQMSRNSAANKNADLMISLTEAARLKDEDRRGFRSIFSISFWFSIAIFFVYWRTAN